MYENDIHTVEVEINEAREWLKRDEALKRLLDNPDFQEVILEGYLKEEAVRLVSLKADPNFFFQGEQQMAYLDMLETGIGALHQYFNLVRQKAEQGRISLDASEETLEQLRQQAMEG